MDRVALAAWPQDSIKKLMDILGGLVDGSNNT